MTQADLAEVWALSLEKFSDLQIEPHQRAWLRLTRPLGLVENTALIATPNEFVKEQLETRLRALITHALSREFGRNIQLAVTVDPATASGGAPTSLETPPVSSPPDQAATHRDVTPAPGPPHRHGLRDPALHDPMVRDPGLHDPMDMGHERPGGYPAAPVDRPGGPGEPPVMRPLPDSGIGGQPAGPPHRTAGLPGMHGSALPRPAQARLNPKYTFETFVIGSSNRFAHAAAVAVAEAPAKAYNPLFIYGDSGLGKTHLLHAIGHYAQSLYQGVKVRYVSSEEFTNDFINMIRDGKDGFR